MSKVLIVEDHLGDFETFSLPIRLAGYEVTHAPNAAKARVEVAAEQFDIAIVDVQLDGSNIGDSHDLVVNELPSVSTVVRWSHSDKYSDLSQEHKREGCWEKRDIQALLEFLINRCPPAEL